MIMLEIVDPLANLLGDWSKNVNIYSIILRIGVALIIGFMVGWERSNKHHAAGLRTFMLAVLGSTVAMILDMFIKEKYDAGIFAISALSVLSLAIISCNTTIYTSKSQIKGLTTSVALWGVGFIGLALGAGLYLTTIILIVIFVLSLSMLPKVETYLKNRSNHFEVHLELTNASYLKDFTTVLRELGIRIYELENNPAYFNSGLSVYTMSLSITKEELQKYKTHQEIIEALKSLPYVAYIEEISF